MDGRNTGRLGFATVVDGGSFIGGTFSPKLRELGMDEA
jgi:hypothetical protein